MEEFGKRSNHSWVFPCCCLNLSLFLVKWHHQTLFVPLPGGEEEEKEEDEGGGDIKEDQAEKKSS